MNDRISRQRELIAKKEGKFYQNKQDFQDRVYALPFEVGQNVWLQNSDSRKCEEAVIRDKCREPNSYMVEIPATGQCFRRNSNFIKPRQSEENSNSTDPQLNTKLPGIPEEPPVLQPSFVPRQAVPSSPATSTVDAIPTARSSAKQIPRTSARINKGIPPPRLGLQEWFFYVYKFYSSSHVRLSTSEREMLRYGSEWHYRQNRIQIFFRLVKC